MSDDPLHASHFYALIETGRMECPRCGLILLFGYGARHPDDRFWSPMSSRLQCRRCGARYVIGLIAWSASRGGGRGRHALLAPPDQRMTPRQLAEVRQRTGGFWEARTLRAEDEANKFIAEGCCCAPLPWRRECAVHGQVGMDESEVVHDQKEDLKE